jgi:hypothetical protein
MKPVIVATLFALTACSATSPPPAVQIKTVEVVKEIQRPCPVKKPERPGPLARPLPTDSIRLNALLALKLADYAAPGGYTDKLEALLAICTKETTP